MRGVWQDIPEVASGWGNAFQFFADGRFVFNHSQMDCGKRELSYSGHWRTTDSGLTVSIEKRRILMGGHMEKAMGSCASDLQLADAVEKVLAEVPPRERVVSLGQLDTVLVAHFNYRTGREESHPIPKMTIGGKPYWKLRDDPNSYP